MMSSEPGSAPSGLAPHRFVPSERLPFRTGPGTVFNLFPLQRKLPPEQRQQQKGTLRPSPQLLGARIQPAKRRGLPANTVKKAWTQGHYHHHPLPFPVQGYLRQAGTVLVLTKGPPCAMPRAFLLLQKSATSMMKVQRRRKHLRNATRGEGRHRDPRSPGAFTLKQDILRGQSGFTCYKGTAVRTHAQVLKKHLCRGVKNVNWHLRLHLCRGVKTPKLAENTQLHLGHGSGFPAAPKPQRTQAPGSAHPPNAALPSPPRQGRATTGTRTQRLGPGKTSSFYALEFVQSAKDVCGFVYLFKTQPTIFAKPLQTRENLGQQEITLLISHFRH